MPNGKDHVFVGRVVGAVAAAATSEAQAPAHRLLEVVGGVVGGGFAARLPDIFEPATSPWHRGTAHSIGVSYAIIKVAKQQLTEWQRQVRTFADALATKRAALPADSFQALALSIAEAACRFVVGLIAGLISGYISHVAMDALTPYGIRLI